MCRLANVEEDNWEWHTFDTIKGGDYLVDQDAAEIMCKGEPSTPSSTSRRWAFRSTELLRGRIDQRRFGGHTATTVRPPCARPATPLTAPGT